MVKEKLAALFLSVYSYISFTASQSGGITEGSENVWEGGPLGILEAALGYIVEMLMIPSSLDPGPIAIWLGGFGFTIYGFRLAVENFDDKMGGWISSGGGVTGSSSKEYWIISSLLTLMFIGGTNFAGWIQSLTALLALGAGLLFFAIAIRVLWFGGSVLGGSALSVGSQARKGAIGKGLRTVADNAQSRWGGGGVVDTLYSQYKNIPRCGVNGHLNPQNPPSGGSPPYNCWIDGCGGDWTP